MNIYSLKMRGKERTSMYYCIINCIKSKRYHLSKKWFMKANAKQRHLKMNKNKTNLRKPNLKTCSFYSKYFSALNNGNWYLIWSFDAKTNPQI